MSKFNRWWFLVFLLVLLLVVGWYGVKLGMINEKWKDEGSENIHDYEKVEKIDSQIGVGIIQYLVDVDKRVTYLLTGRFLKELTRFDNGALYGLFVVEGDTKKRSIEVDMTDNKMFMGVYEENFEGNSKWDFVSNDLVVKLIKPGDLVLLKMTQEFGKKEWVDEYYLEVQRVLKGLSDDIKLGQGNYIIPGDFNLSPTGIGIIE